MESRKVDSPGPLGSPLTTAASAPGGSVVGNDQCSEGGSVEDCAMAPGAATNHMEAAMRTYRPRVTRLPSSMFPLSYEPVISESELLHLTGVAPGVRRHGILCLSPRCRLEQALDPCVEIPGDRERCLAAIERNEACSRSTTATRSPPSASASARC
jgi:hypothetical protein